MSTIARSSYSTSPFFIMNYQKIYDQIIDQAQKQGRRKSKEDYYESHHILPKCLGGSNQKENLVLLTGREHFLAHRLLVEIYPKNAKLLFAFWGMCNMRKKGQEGRYVPSSGTYEKARKDFSANRIAFYQTSEGRASMEKRTANFDYLAKNNNTDWVAKAKKCMKPILQFTKDGIFVREWSSVKEAGESLKIVRGDISYCLTGRLKTAGKFIWKYKEKKLYN
jgi:hypothetical protein